MRSARCRSCGAALVYLHRLSIWRHVTRVAAANDHPPIPDTATVR